RLTRWTGYINVVRPGQYRFSAAVRGGSLAVQVNGRTVLTGQADGKEPKAIAGQEVALEGGVQRFEATFQRDDGAFAQVELSWQGPGFRMEPLPHQFLGHLAKERPPQFATDVQLEHGRFLFEELACIRCHKPAAGDRMAKGLVDRAGPSLTEVAKRSYAGWLDAWLSDPAGLRPHTAMPRLFADNDAGQAERFAVVKYLVALAGKPLEPLKAPTL